MATCKECLHVAVCGRCVATGGRVRDCEHFVGDDNVGSKEVITNADRIRAMSDRELAWWLAERYAKEAVLTLQDRGVTPSATEIKAVTERLYMTWVRWLMATAEVENGN